MNMIEEDEGMIETVRLETGPYLAEALASLSDHELVGEVRSCGMLGCVELVADKNGPVLFEESGAAGVVVRDHAISGGLMMRAVRDGMIASPPLSFTKSDIDLLVARLRLALDKAAPELLG